jgi:acetyl/propionyl-CoA carboxylase alpha subunit
LSELVIVGLPTSQPFHLRVMDDAAFLKGEIDITYLERAGARLLAAAPRAGLERALAVAAAVVADEARMAGRPDGRTAGETHPVGLSPWVVEGRRLGLRDGLE